MVLEVHLHAPHTIATLMGYAGSNERWLTTDSGHNDLVFCHYSNNSIILQNCFNSTQSPVVRMHSLFFYGFSDWELAECFPR